MSIVRFTDLAIDLDRGLIERHGARVPLRPKAFALLACFAGNPNRIISKDELVAQVWQQTAVTDDALTQKERYFSAIDLTY